MIGFHQKKNRYLLLVLEMDLFLGPLSNSSWGLT